MWKNKKMDETPTEDKPQEMNSTEDESTRKTSPPKVTFQADKGEIRNQQKKSNISDSSSGVGEDERFFLDLYPDLRRSMMGFIRRRLSSSPISFIFGQGREVVEDVYLQREFGLFDSINFLLIVSIGTGIYLSPGVVLKRAGSMTEALVIWLLSGILSCLIAVTYGELICLITQSGARFSFLLAAFSPFHSFFGPFPAFLSIWIDILFLGPAEVSLLTLVVAENMFLVFDTTFKTYYNFEVTEPAVVKQAIAIAVLGFITSINLRSIKTLVKILKVLGLLKVLFCLFVILCGVYTLSTGHTKNFEHLFKDMKGNTTGLVKALYSGMWAYSGWNNVVTMAEEIKNPLWTIPAAVLMGLPLVTFIYLSMNIAFLSILTPNEITEESSKFIFEFEAKLFGSRGMIMPVCMSIAAISCAICIQLGYSRSCFAAGREGHMLELHSYLNVKRLVPSPAIITQTPLCLPIILITISVLVTLNPFFSSTAHSSVPTAAAFTFLGMYVYYKTVYNQQKLICMDKINEFIRVTLNVEEPTALPEGYAHRDTRAKTVSNRLRSKERYYSTVGSVLRTRTTQHTTDF